MTEKRFDIVVQDKVARTIKSELASIGSAARSARNDLNQLYSAMGARASSAATAAQAAATRTAASTARVDAAATQSASRRVAASARVKASLETEAQQHLRLASVVERAAQRQEAAANRTAAANARAASAGPVYTGSRAVTARQNAMLRGGGGGGGGGGPADPVVNTAMATAAVANARAITQVGTASRLSAQSAAQLGFQLNDVFVSLASGQRPMTVFIQQGAQIAQLPAQMGQSWKQFGAAALNTLGIVKRTGDAALDAAAAQAVAAAEQIASANAQAAANVRTAETEIALARAQQQAAVTATEQAAASTRLAAANQALSAANAEATVTSRALAAAQGQAAEASTAANLASTRSLSGFARGGIAAVVAITALTVTLGALKSQANDDSGLRKFNTSMGYTASEVKKLNAVTVTWGDTAKAVFQVAAARVASAFGISTADIRNAWNNALSWMASATRATMAGIYAAVAGMAYGVKNIIDNIGDNKSNDNPLKNVIEGYREAYNDAQGFFDDVVAQARRNARGRQDAMASEMAGAGKKAPKAASGWNRAEEWRKANEELDIQIGMLGKYGEALERAQQIEQIGRQFREHNAPLTAAEVQILDEKILKLQEGRQVQEAMTAAEEDANGPRRQFEAQQEALNRLLASGAITAEDYTNQLTLAQRAYIDSIDPLAALNRELQRSGELMGLYGRDRDVANYIDQLRQAAEARGQSIFKRATGRQGDNDNIVVTGHGGLTDDAQAMVDQFRQQQRRGELAERFEEIDPREKVLDTNEFILQNYREMYAEIARLREEDVISEQEAAERKKNLDTALGEARLQTASDVFGTLAQLSSSKTKEIAAVGKAAAIAEATINGILAVQAALKAPPGPPYTIPMAVAVGVMSAANVAKIAGIGFERGGYTGNGGTSEPAGTVHGQEYVFDAAATRRIGVPALDAMRAGARLNGAASNDNRGRGVTVHQYPGVAVEVRERTDGEIEVIAERAARRVAPSAVAADMRDPNSRTSKAMQTNFGTRRQR
jgi:hypothetical protein